MKKHITLLILAFIVFTGIDRNQLQAADYYWVKGVNASSSGNWSDLSHWASTSGAAVGGSYGVVPTSLDNVFFDAGSFTSTGQTVTIDPAIATCLNMSWTGVTNTPALSCVSGKTLKVSGSLTFVTGMTISFAGTLSFESIGVGNTVTTAGKTFASGNIVFNGTGGEWTLQDALSLTGTSNTTGTVTLTKGTLNTNNQNVNACCFFSTNANVRALNLGSSTFTLTYALWFWDLGTSTNLTFNAGTSTITGITGQAGFSQSFNGGNLTYNNVNFNASINTGATINGNNTFNNVAFSNHGFITGNNTFNNLTFAAGYTYTLTNGKTQTVNSTYTANGTCGSYITLVSSLIGSTSTIRQTSGAVTINFAYLRDMNATGGATFTANNTISLGNNPGWTINATIARDLYWIGNTGNWSDGNHWSLTSGGVAVGCGPTSLDNVFFDANSFSLATRIVTVDVPSASCNDISWTGVTNTPTLLSVTGKILNIYGSMTLVSAMTLNFSGAVNFEAKATGKTLTSAGKIFTTSNISFNGIGGGWTLQDALSTTGTSNTTGVITLNKGTLNTNNQTVNACIFNSSNSNVRALNMGSSTFNLTYALWFWETSTTTNFTFNSGTSTINGNVGQAGFSQSFNAGNLVYYNINFNATINLGATINGNSTYNNVVFVKHGFITGNNTFNNLTFAPGFTYKLTAAKTQTINGIFSVNGTCSAPIILQSLTAAATTISHPAGAVTINSTTLTWVSGIGGATYTANSSVDGGNNTGWTINTTSARDLYWIGNSGNWNDGTHWSLTSGGIASGCAPGFADNVFFDANSFSLNGQTVTVNVPTANCNNMDWTGMSKTTTFACVSGNTMNIYGSMTFVPIMTLNFSGTVNFEATSTGKNITSGGKTFTTSNISFNGLGGSWTLQDALSTTGTSNTTGVITLNRGTLNTNNQTVNACIFNSSNINVRALNMGSSTFNLTYALWFWETSTATNFTFNSGTSTINGITGQVGFSQSFNAGNLVYNNVNFNATINTGATINGNSTFNNVTFLNHGFITGNNTFNNLTFSPSFNYTLTSGKTQTITSNLNISGTGSFPVLIQSSTPGSFSTFSKASGTICADYIRLSDNKALGGASFNTGTNSQDLGGNTGWDFPGMSVTPASLNASANPICNTGTQLTWLSQSAGSLGNLSYWQWYTDPTYTTLAGGQVSLSTADLSVSPTSTTTYYLRAEWAQCISPLAGPPAGLAITVNTVPLAPVASVIQPTCAVITGTVNLTGLPSSGSWTINPGAISGSGTSNSIPFLAPGSYSYTVTDVSGCISPSSNTVVLVAGPVGLPGHWLGNISSDWSDSDNWCDGVPVSTTDVTIPSGTPNTAIISSAGIALCKNLTIDSGASLTINSGSDLSINGDFTHNGISSLGIGEVRFSGTVQQNIQGTSTPQFGQFKSNNSSVGSAIMLQQNIQVSGTLDMSNGNIDLNGKNINLGSTGQISNETTTTRIFGTSGEITTTRILSASTVYSNIAGLGVSITTDVTAPGLTLIDRGHTSHQQLSSYNSISRYFDITPTVNSGLNATLKISYLEVEIDDVDGVNPDETKFIPWRSIDGGLTWEGQFFPTRLSNDAVSNYVQLTQVDGFSRWTLSDFTTEPLPVELLSFTATASDHKVILNWNTASEINNDYFQIERSNDAVHFQTILSMDGAGNSNSLLEYLQEDTYPLPGVSYYRLRQIDFNGTSTYSEIAPVNLQANNLSSALIWVNATAEIVVVLNNRLRDLYHIELYDSRGARVHTQSNLVEPETTTVVISNTKLASGIYLMRFVGVQGDVLVEKLRMP